MIPSRVEKNYNRYIESMIFYQQLFNNSGDIMSLLNLPYPIFIDLIEKQLHEKNKEKKAMEKAMHKEKVGNKTHITTRGGKFNI